MGYAIELSTNSRKPTRLIINTEERRQQAENYMCEMQYFTHEVEGKKQKIVRLDSIQVVIFSSENFELMLKYIRNINKIREIDIECIYRDDSTCDLLYASPKYLKKMNKQVVKSFKKDLKNKIIKSNEESAILEAIKCR